MFTTLLTSNRKVWEILVTYMLHVCLCEVCFHSGMTICMRVYVCVRVCLWLCCAGWCVYVCAVILGVFPCLCVRGSIL